MLRKILLFILFAAFISPSVLAQTALDSLIADGTVDQIIEELESNDSIYSRTRNLKRQIAYLNDQPDDYISSLATDLSKRKAKFNQEYVSEESRALLELSGKYYDADANMQAVHYYVVADFMRGKEYVATENNLKSAIGKAEIHYNEKNYVEAQYFIDQADQIIADNPIFKYRRLHKDYRIELTQLRKKNKWKLTKGHAENFETIWSEFTIKANLLYGFASTANSDLILKHRPYSQLRTDISHLVRYEDVMMSEEVGVGITLQYQYAPLLWVSAKTRLWPMLKTAGTVNYSDQGLGKVNYSFRTLLVDANLGLTYYYYESEKVRFYGNAGVGVVQGFMKDQIELENRFGLNLGQYGDLYHVKNSYTKPMISAALGIDFTPFARGSYLNAEAQFDRYFDIQAASPESFFSISLGAGVYF